QIKLAYGLHCLENNPDLALPDAVKCAFDRFIQSDFPVDRLGEPGTRGCAEVLSALADQKVVLPLRDYARLVKQDELTAAAAPLLSGVYGRLLADGSLDKRRAVNPLAAAPPLASYATRCWATKLAAAFSLDDDAVRGRAYLAAVRDHKIQHVLKIDKTAADGHAGTAAVEELARSYACYKLAALHRIAAFDADFLLTARLGVVQNQVV